MTTLYRPVLIESAEQAEALPIGTMAARENRFYSVKLGDDLWTDGMSAPWHDAEMVGWTALVPIEVTALEDPPPGTQNRKDHPMTADEFTTAARAEAERRNPPIDRYPDDFTYPRAVLREHKRGEFGVGAEWARDHLAADIREAQAEAWDEGRLSGEFLGVHANPYREKEADHD